MWGARDELAQAVSLIYAAIKLKRDSLALYHTSFSLLFFYGRLFSLTTCFKMYIFYYFYLFFQIRDFHTLFLVS